MQAVTVQFWLLLVEEALLSIGGMKFKATSLESSSFRLHNSLGTPIQHPKSPSGSGWCTGLSKKL